MDGTLGEFLQSRRARIQLEDVGLPPHGRRRVPGLRREEVAQLAGVSVEEKTYGKRISHPLAGELHLGYETLTLPGDPDQTIVVHTASPGSATAERLAALASWHAGEHTEAVRDPQRPR